MQEFLVRPFVASLLSRALAFLVLLGAFATPAVAEAASAQDHLKAKQAELTALVKSEASDKLTAAFDELLDYPALAEASLGDEWSKLSETQRADFQKLLVTLIQRAYKKSIKETLSYDISFLGEENATKGKLVHTVAKHKTDARKEPLRIDYVLHQTGGKWRVIDIVTEDSSLVANYKSQFRRVIEKKGFSGLIELMAKKVAES